MKVILFRSYLKPGVDMDAYERDTAAMYALVREIPGFIAAEDFTGDDGERLAVITFRDDESLRLWREHPEHRGAQARGRSVYYASYRLQICDLERVASFGE